MRSSRKALGHLSVGAPADIAVLRLENGSFGFVDSFGGRLRAKQKLVNEMTLRDGKVVYDLNGLARPDWETLPRGLQVDGRSPLDPRPWEVRMAKSNRRSFLAKAPALAVATVGASAAAVAAQDKPAAKAPRRARAGEAGEEGALERRQGAGEAGPCSARVVSYGNLLFISGIGAHFEGDIKAHTDHVLKEIQKKLESAGSSMEKVLKVNVYLNDLKDYAAHERGVPGPLRRGAGRAHHDRGRGRDPRKLAGRDRLHRLYLTAQRGSANAT